jgi:hypothetical protein
MGEATRDAGGVSSVPRSFPSILDRPIRVGLVSALLALVIVAVLAVAWGNGVSGFVHAAPPRTDRALAPSGLKVLPADHGFDGQFYYRLAISPFSTAKRVAGVTFDIPTLRQSRIGYPLLARVTSLGNRDAVPFALLAVNVVAMFLLGFLGARIALDSGRVAAWGLLFALYPGFVYSLGFDLGEIVAAVFVLATLIAVRRGRIGLAIVAAVAAVLTRETTAVVPLGFLVAGAWPWWRHPAVTDRRAALAVGITPLVVLAGWQLWLRETWGSLPLTDSGDKNVKLPFAGWIDQIDKFVPPTSRADLYRDLLLGFLFVVLIGAAIAFTASTARRHEKIALVFAVLLLPLLSGAVWGGATSFMRASTEAYLLAVVVMLPARIAAERLVLTATVATLGVTVASEVVKAR